MNMFYYDVEFLDGHITLYKIEAYTREIADSILITIMKKELHHA